MAVSITEDRYDSPDGARMVNELALDLGVRYGRTPADDPEPLDADDFGVFLLARGPGGDALGCGALRLLDGHTAEIKRMFVVPAARGTGVSTAILRGLEEHARARDIKTMVLSTGTRQPEAIRFYQREGYQTIEGFGPFKDHPLGVFLGRRLV
jgi:GNAT superfamily N-acetyltransferase